MQTMPLSCIDIRHLSGSKTVLTNQSHQMPSTRSCIFRAWYWGMMYQIPFLIGWFRWIKGKWLRQLQQRRFSNNMLCVFFFVYFVCLMFRMLSLALPLTSRFFFFFYCVEYFIFGYLEGWLKFSLAAGANRLMVVFFFFWCFLFVSVLPVVCPNLFVNHDDWTTFTWFCFSFIRRDFGIYRDKTQCISVMTRLRLRKWLGLILMHHIRMHNAKIIYVSECVCICLCILLITVAVDSI